MTRANLVGATMQTPDSHLRHAHARTIAFMFRRFYDAERQAFAVGGVETYIHHLANLAAALGLEPLVFQPAHDPFTVDLEHATVIGVPVTHLGPEEQKHAIYGEVLRRTGSQDVIVFGADHYSVPTTRPRTISIQHGIDWDLPVGMVRRLPWLVPEFRMRRDHARRVRRVLGYFENCRNHVCVDYNFPNWYRATTGRDIPGKLWIIPNCGVAARPEQIIRPRGPARILFARRFEQYRGTRLMADAVAAILATRPTVHVTFAGDGPDEWYLHERFHQCPQVCFTRYSPHQSLDIHLAHDIAVIPSLGSEGTTLVAAEAMGAGCAVVATAIGGLTNMILDGYNGLLVRPRSEDLIQSLTNLIDDESLRFAIANRGYDTAVRCFNVDSWRERWTRVLQQLLSDSEATALDIEVPSRERHGNVQQVVEPCRYSSSS